MKRKAQKKKAPKKGIHRALSPAKRRVVNLMSRGMKQKEAAKIVGLSEARVSGIVNEPEVQDAMAKAFENNDMTPDRWAKTIKDGVENAKWSSKEGAMKLWGQTDRRIGLKDDRASGSTTIFDVGTVIMAQIIERGLSTKREDYSGD